MRDDLSIRGVTKGLAVGPLALTLRFGGSMDPITITIITIICLLGGGGMGLSVRNTRRRQARQRMRDAIRVRQQVKDAEVSVFDVFWDLGVSDFALEIMGNQGLLLKDMQDLPFVLDALEDRVAEHGSYATFVRENLEAIQEFYEEHRRAGDRRALPALENKKRKTLQLPAVIPDGGSKEVSGTGSLPVLYDGGSNGTGIYKPIVAKSPDERIAVREGRQVHALQLSASEVDIDEIAKVDPVRMLGGIFDGTLSVQLERWWEMRNLRMLRTDLDQELVRLYNHYADEANASPSFFQHLFDTARRWDAEVGRIAELKEKAPWEGRPWEICADALVTEALAVARKLSWMARGNVETTIEHIHGRARSGDLAMAGYLVYLNHHALFAGRSQKYGDHVRRVENATYKVQRELRELMQKGVI